MGLRLTTPVLVAYLLLAVASSFPADAISHSSTATAFVSWVAPGALRPSSEWICMPSSRPLSARSFESRLGVGPRQSSFRAVGGANGGESSEFLQEFTVEELEATADLWGLSLSYSTLGPFYRAVVRLKTRPDQDGDEDKGGAVGYTSGSILATLMRQDTMRISSVAARPCKTWIHLFAGHNPVRRLVNTGNEFSRPADRLAMVEERGWRSPSVNGISILLGAYALAHGLAQGCRRCELLAIMDSEKQHRVLLRHYKRLGMVPVRDITEDIACVPDRMIWGGIGTLMEAEIEPLLLRNAAELRRMRKPSQTSS